MIEALDGQDNGISQYPSELTPAYKESTNLSARVGSLNPWWNQKISDAEVDVSIPFPLVSISQLFHLHHLPPTGSLS